ncbi:TetR/AcrR family transcriptional regulator [Alteromonas gilva]|uniref:TetR family transcriptional regulator n=1 Tax=Alteromonas gilva TaxID=2987522 RepID=A0ABT5L584_9ALTE|nr:TetR family transcriptional regulator [Alteromonas gilva]MDC8832218.1 TetR family transcriptional regulator [Alteromonas gilva]
MPYSKAHKQRTRQIILKHAYTLFSSRGYSAVTIDEVMRDSGLTRGAFYAHFKSKSELYKEALTFSAFNTSLAERKPAEISTSAWLGQLLDQYLSVAHVNGERPCPLAFLATDVVSRDTAAKTAYTHTYQNMNKLIWHYARQNAPCTEQDILGLTSMIIGAVAVARTIEDQSLVVSMLSACRQQARLILGGI